MLLSVPRLSCRYLHLSLLSPTIIFFFTRIPWTYLQYERLWNRLYLYGGPLIEHSDKCVTVTCLLRVACVMSCKHCTSFIQIDDFISNHTHVCPLHLSNSIMSFQHFRVPIAPHPGSETYHTNPGPSSYQAAANELTQVAFSSQIQSHGDPYQHDLQPMPNASLNKKGPYGSGDADDGYTLCFPSMAAFLEWKQKEEDEKMIEFVKGDSHQSRANPPRFKEHTKLVCARHSRSGRKKYVKKYPDRVRKVPSRKVSLCRFANIASGGKTYCAYW